MNLAPPEQAGACRPLTASVKMPRMNPFRKPWYLLVLAALFLYACEKPLDRVVDDLKSDDPQVRGRYEVMEYPVGIAYYAWGAAWVTHWLNGSPDLQPRYSRSPDGLASDDEVRQEIRIFVVVNTIGFAAAALLSV